MYKKLLEHLGHNIEIVGYRKGSLEIQNISIECLDCNEVLTSFDLPEEENGLSVIVNINIEIPTNAKTEEEAIVEAENYELPNGYVEDSFKIVKLINNK